MDAGGKEGKKMYRSSSIQFVRNNWANQCYRGTKWALWHHLSQYQGRNHYTAKSDPQNKPADGKRLYLHLFQSWFICTWSIYLHLYIDFTQCVYFLYCIRLHLQKAEQMNHSNTLPDNSSHCTEEVKNQTDDSSNLITPKSYRTDREPSVVARLNQFSLQKNTVERDEQERGKWVRIETISSIPRFKLGTLKWFYLFVFIFILSWEQEGMVRSKAHRLMKRLVR